METNPLTVHLQSLKETYEHHVLPAGGQFQLDKPRLSGYSIVVCAAN